MLPAVLPPGSESLALAALTFAFRLSAVERAFKRASIVLCEKHGSDAESELPTPESASRMLIEGYAASALGMVPEAENARCERRPTKPSGANVLDGEGSLLPLPCEWLFCGVSSRTIISFQHQEMLAFRGKYQQYLSMLCCWQDSEAHRDTHSCPHDAACE